MSLGRKHDLSYINTALKCDGYNRYDERCNEDEYDGNEYSGINQKDEKKEIMINEKNKEKFSKVPFIKIPNNLILYSLQHNRTILPLYMYANTHVEVHNHNQFNFSLSFITSFFVSLQKRSGYTNKFKDGLQVLLEGDVPNNISNSFQLENITGDNIENDKNGVITITILDRTASIVNGWTPIYFDEYYYIVNSVKQRNQGLTGKEEWNLIDLINIYSYLKSQILLIHMVNKTKKTNIPYAINFKKIIELTGLGEKTIVKYIKELSELNLIQILSESQYKKLQKQNRTIQKQKYSKYYMMEIDDTSNNILNQKIKYGYSPKENNIIELNEDWRDNNE